jgi:hypothetical protein
VENVNKPIKKLNQRPEKELFLSFGDLRTDDVLILQAL